MGGYTRPLLVAPRGDMGTVFGYLSSYTTLHCTTLHGGYDSGTDRNNRDRLHTRLVLVEANAQRRRLLEELLLQRRAARDAALRDALAAPAVAHNEARAVIVAGLDERAHHRLERAPARQVAILGHARQHAHHLAHRAAR